MAITIQREGGTGEGAPVHRWLVLGICSMSLLIIGMDVTIVNVALPVIRQDLGASVAGLQWMVSGYTVALASLLVLGGSTADRLGRARIFKTGLALFTASSLACSLAPTEGWLIAGRVVQGVSASMLNPVAMSIIRTVFEDPRERAQAIGIWGAVVGVSMAAGPVLGGLLVPLSWRAVFLVNVPIGLLALALTARFVPESRAPRPRRFDPIGQLLLIAVLTATTVALIEGPELGWGDPVVLLLAAVAACALAAFIPHALRRREPLIEPRFFASVPFSAATSSAVLAFTALGGFLFVNTLYLQEARGFSPLVAGLCTLPLAAMTIVVSPVSGRIVGLHGVRWPMVVGGAGIALSALMLTQLSPATPVGWLLLAYVVFGVGLGAVNPPITNSAVAGMPASQAGVAAAVASTSRMVGQTLGVALVGSIATAGAGAALAVDLPAQSHGAWWLIAGLGTAIVVLGLVASTPSALRSAERTAERLPDGPAAAGAPVAAPAGGTG